MSATRWNSCGCAHLAELVRLVRREHDRSVFLLRSGLATTQKIITQLKTAPMYQAAANVADFELSYYSMYEEEDDIVHMLTLQQQGELWLKQFSMAYYCA